MVVTCGSIIYGPVAKYISDTTVNEAIITANFKTFITAAIGQSPQPCSPKG